MACAMSRLVNSGVSVGSLSPPFPLGAARKMNKISTWAGAAAIWFGDHYVNFFPPAIWNPRFTPAAKAIPNPDAIHDHVSLMAITGAQLKGVNIGTAVTEPGRHHPMALAQRFVTLDHLTKGHAILGIGAGEYENTAPYGIDFRRPVARLEEALQVIRFFWDNPGKPLSYDGAFFQLREAYYDLPFFDGAPPPIFVAAHGPRMLRITGTYAEGWIPSVLPAPGEYREMLRVIEEAASGANRPFDRFVPAQMVTFALGRSHQEIMDKVLRSPLAAAICMLMPDAKWKRQGQSHPLGEGHRGFFKIMPHAVTEQQVLAVRDRLTPELVQSSFWVGTHSEILERCAVLVEEGARHLAFIDMTPLFDATGAAWLWRQVRLLRAASRL
jgi:phthiodiolone/phenolphthiodiolone dimycocerosates ketoreductase